MDNRNGRDLVRAGYNVLSHYYRGDHDPAEQYDGWPAGLRTRLPEHADVLDIGCGCGTPVARDLTRLGTR